MKVYIMFHTSSIEVIYEGVNDVYTKDGLLCLSFDNEIIKFPLCNVFSIRSNYKKA